MAEKMATTSKSLLWMENEAAELSGMCKTEVEKTWSRVYRMLHMINSPKCRKNHPEWVKDFSPGGRANPRKRG